MPELSWLGDVALMHLGNDENLCSTEWMARVDELISEVLRRPGPRALVTHGAGKFFSSGFDRKVLEAAPQSAAQVTADFHHLLVRLLTLPMPTVAAVNGHAFGAGALLALAHDFRLMRADRGFFCFPELTVRIAFTRGMTSLITAKLTPATAIESMTTARRYGADARSAGLVDDTCSADELIDAAVTRVEPLAAGDSRTLGQIKAELFRQVVEALEQPGQGVVQNS